MRPIIRRAAATVALTLLAAAPAQAAGPPDSVAAKLRAKGHPPAAVEALQTTSSYPGLRGVRHVRLEQRAGGLRVHGATVRAALASDGRVVHLIDEMADATGAVAPAAVGAAAAAAAAGGGTAEPVAIARGGRFAQGYLVETWDADGLRYTLVDGNGAVVSVENRTNSDSYNVFTEDPGKTPQAIITGPGTWLGTGAQLTTHISGNNTRTYLDRDNNNAADPGGSPVTDGNFTTAANLALAPTTASNQAVAVQNLFFLNNRVHDILYDHGFTEAAGNFQVDNFGLGGLGGDPVLAEAQDGGGLDNANFSSPADGSSPRMQMYLWSSAEPTHEVVVGAAAYGAVPAGFGAPVPAGGLTAEAVAVVPADACATPTVALAGRIALADRGTCDFIVKARNVQRAGAVGLIVANNVAGPPITMSGGGGIRIPAVMISQADGAALRAQLPASVTMRPDTTPGLQIDGSLDSDIVYHEYGHGLTWRMIGGMSGPVAGAIGEGASDTLAMLINGDDRIAEYAGSFAGGLRSAPYDGYTRTYGDLTGDSIHFDGEIYAAIMWRLIESFADDDRLFDLWVDGMNYTPATPAYEDMRDGMLQAAAGSSAEQCLIWQAFAAGGVGVGADVTGRGKLRVTESFEVPAGC